MPNNYSLVAQLKRTALGPAGGYEYYYDLFQQTDPKTLVGTYDVIVQPVTSPLTIAQVCGKSVSDGMYYATTKTLRFVDDKITGFKYATGSITVNSNDIMTNNNEIQYIGLQLNSVSNKNQNPVKYSLGVEANVLNGAKSVLLTIVARPLTDIVKPEVTNYSVKYVGTVNNADGYIERKYDIINLGAGKELFSETNMKGTLIIESGTASTLSIASIAANGTRSLKSSGNQALMFSHYSTLVRLPYDGLNKTSLYSEFAVKAENNSSVVSVAGYAGNNLQDATSIFTMDVGSDVLNGQKINGFINVRQIK